MLLAYVEHIERLKAEQQIPSIELARWLEWVKSVGTEMDPTGARLES